MPISKSAVWKARQSGRSLTDLANDFGVTRERIYQICRVSDQSARRTADFIERARSLWGDGLSASEIGTHLGVSKNVIIGVAARNGFAKRPSLYQEGCGAMKVSDVFRARPCTACGATAEPVVICVGMDGETLDLCGTLTVMRRPVPDRCYCSIECARSQGWPWLAGECAPASPRGSAGRVTAILDVSSLTSAAGPSGSAAFSAEAQP